MGGDVGGDGDVTGVRDEDDDGHGVGDDDDDDVNVDDVAVVEGKSVGTLTR